MFFTFSYESLIKRTQFADNSPDFITMEYYTDCGGQFPSLRKRNYCNNVTLGKEIEFFVDVTLKEYPIDKVYVSRKIIHLYISLRIPKSRGATEIVKDLKSIKKVPQNMLQKTKKLKL